MLDEGDQAKKARTRHIWRVGVLGWGAWMLVAITLSDWYKAGYIQIPPFHRLLSMTVPNLIIWPIAGYLFGALTWKHRRGPGL